MPSPVLCRCVPAYRSVLLRSIRPAAGPAAPTPPFVTFAASCAAGRDPLPRAFARGRGRVFAPARFARLIARARGRGPGRRKGSRAAGTFPDMSCDVMFAMPSPVFCRSVPAYRSVLFRSVHLAAGPAAPTPPFVTFAASCTAGRDPLPRAFARGRRRVSAPARFARLIARARGRGPGRRKGSRAAGTFPDMSCDVMFAMPSPVFCRSVPAYRSVLFRSVHLAAGPAAPTPPFVTFAASCTAGRDPLPRAFAYGRGRVFAPARFARLIARARGQAPGAPPLSAPLGVFSSRRRLEWRSSLRMAASSRLIWQAAPRSQAILRIIMNICEQKDFPGLTGPRTAPLPHPVRCPAGQAAAGEANLFTVPSIVGPALRLARSNS